MASLQELRGLYAHSDLMEKIEAAMIIAVQAVLDGSPTTADQKYAAYVFTAPHIEARKALMSVLAKNKTATTAQITGASDAAIQVNVDAVVPTLSAAWNAANP